MTSLSVNFVSHSKIIRRCIPSQSPKFARRTCCVPLAHTYIHTYIHTYVRTYVYVRTYIHTYVHPHMYTCMCKIIIMNVYVCQG